MAGRRNCLPAVNAGMIGLFLGRVFSAAFFITIFIIAFATPPAVSSFQKTLNMLLRCSVTIDARIRDNAKN
jgi:hypothetical protein